MNRRELLKQIKYPPKFSSNYQSISFGFGYTPYPDNNVVVASAYVGALYYNKFKNKKTGKIFNSIIAYNGKDYTLRCGDIFLEARLSTKRANDLATNAVHFFDDKYKYKLKKELNNTYGLLGCDGECESLDMMCEHKDLLLNTLTSEIIREIEQLYFYIQEGYLESMNQPANINSLFKRYAFKKHVLIEGEKGSGKTYLIHNWCEKVKIPEIFLGGHEQLESIDFLGHYIQDKDGSFLWKDGALTEAFRVAASGKRVVLIIDEILRIPKRELNILIYSLIAYNNNYILRTGRAIAQKDGIATEETIYAPKNKLWVVGTTNIGAGYAVEEIDEALADRFRLIRKDSTRAEMEKILIKYAKIKKYSKTSVLRLIRFFTEMRRFKSQDILNKIINIRHLVEAIEYAPLEGEIPDVLQETILAWVDRDIDGYPLIAQTEIIEKLIREIWELEDTKISDGLIEIAQDVITK